MFEKNDQIKIVFLADSHLGFDYPIRPRSKRRRRGDDFFSNYQSILDRTQSLKADLLIHGGDMFFRSRVHDKIVDLAYEPLLAVAEAGIPIFIVPGNHERSTLPDSLLLAHRNIFVFDKPKTFALKINGLKLTLSGFPFQRANIRDDFKRILAATKFEQHKADIKLLCIHQTVEGATVGPVDYTFRYGKDTTKLADFPFDFDAVLSGHIHRHQILTKQNAATKKNLPIVYPGSIERTAFAEKDEDKGFVEIFCSKSGIDRIDFIKLPARPMIDLTIDRVDDINALKASLSAAIADFDQNAIVRINIDKDLPDEFKQRLNTSFFQSVLPHTLNFQFGKGLYKPNRMGAQLQSGLRQKLIARIKREVPGTAGIYIFYGSQKKVIYIGKSVNLRQRMLSYFYQSTGQLENRMRQMIFNIENFSFTKTQTELLALVLEDCLIKKHLPVYNIKQQEFSEYRYLMLTNDRFPTLKIIAPADIQNCGGHIFGPFKDEYFIRDLSSVIYRHLNLRQCQDREPVQKSMNYNFGLCAGPCRGTISPEDYGNIVCNVTDFLGGDDRHLVAHLSREMERYSAALEFEEAARVKTEIEFCRNFCRRQRFIHRFKTSVLVIYDNDTVNAKYEFDRGELISAQIGTKKIDLSLFSLFSSQKHDSRYQLDRANLVYRWLKVSKDVTCDWHSPNSSAHP